MIEVIIPIAIVATILLIAVIVQGEALSRHKREIARLRALYEHNRDQEQHNREEAERLDRDRRRAAAIGSTAHEIVAREREGNRRAAPILDRIIEHNRRMAAERAARIESAPQAQGDSGLMTGIIIGNMLSSSHPQPARAHDAPICPPQAPSVESAFQSPSCDAPSPSSSYDSSPSSSSDSGSSFNSGGTD